MRITVEYEGDKDYNTPINFAKAVIDFMTYDEDKKGCQEYIMETVDYLNVYVRNLKNRRMMDAF